MRNMRKKIAKFLYVAHVGVIAVWWGLFFVPLSWWADRVFFHFYLSLFIVIQQFLWGFLIMPWTKKYRMVCSLTTLTQLLRGKNIADKENYSHSFLKEIFAKGGIKIPSRAPTAITFAVLALTVIQYIRFK